MKPQHMILSLLLVFFGLLGDALGAAIQSDCHPALPSGPNSLTTNGADITSITYFLGVYPTGVPLGLGQPFGHSGGHSSGPSYGTLAAQMNTSWAPVTNTYTQTNLDWITPISLTETYTDRSTELTTTTLDLTSVTQTIVEIAGYSTIDTYTTTLLAPAINSTYSMVETVTSTSTELLVPSVATLTFTGSLPPTTYSLLEAQKRGSAWRPVESGTGVLPSRNPMRLSSWGNLTASPSEQHATSIELTDVLPTLTSAHVPLYLSAAVITPSQSPSSSADLSDQAESDAERSGSSSTNVMVFTVTNTYSLTPTSEHTLKTISRSKESSTTWPTISPARSNSTHYLSSATMHNTSAVIHATTATMVPDSSSRTVIHSTTDESSTTVPAKVTGTTSPTPASGSSVIFNCLVLNVSSAMLAIVLFFVV